MDWIFIHIPRTAGSSIRQQVGFGAAPFQLEHLPLDAYHMCLRQCLRRAQVFTIVRNPYDRAVSLCALEMAVGKPPLPVDVFEEWAHNGPTQPTALCGDTPFKVMLSNLQTRWIDPLNVDYIGRFEDLPAARKRISEITGQELDDRRTRSGNHGPWRDYYRSDEVRKLVYEMYRPDFEAFGYTQ